MNPSSLKTLRLSPVLLAGAALLTSPLVTFANLPHTLLEARLAGFESRQSLALQKQVSNTFPGPTDPAPVNGYGWNKLDFALAALYLNTQVDEANAAIVEMTTVYLAADPKEYTGEKGLHWIGNLLVRVHELFCADSAHFPGRLTPTAEARIRALLWEWASREGSLDPASLNDWKTWHIHDSENHDAMRDATAWGAAQILRRYAPYKDSTYQDGTSPDTQYAGWNEYLIEYLRERGRKGLLVEYRSNTYSKYTLQCFYNYFDFAENPTLEYLAGAVLDLWWADAAQESIDGIAGGAGSRWARPDDLNGSGYSSAGMIWYYTAEGTAKNVHPALMPLITSTYRVPLVVMDLALDDLGRGTFESISRKPGLDLAGYENQWQVDHHYILDPDYGGILRYTYVTPDFVMGTSMFDKLHNDDWSAISSQNRWHGVVIKGDPRTVIVPQAKATTSNLRGLNEQWSVQDKGTLITQKNMFGERISDMRVYIPPLGLMSREEVNGWVLLQNDYAYAAVRPATGGYTWDELTWMKLNDDYSPIIIELVRASDYASYDDFKNAILAQSIEINSSLGDEALFYTSVSSGASFTFFTHPANTSRPRINGVEADLTPDFTYQSPYVEGSWPASIVKIRKGQYEKILNFEADLTDPNNPGQWIEPPELSVSLVDGEVYGRERAALRLQLSEASPVDTPVYLRLDGTGAGSVTLSPAKGPYVIPAGSTELIIDIRRDDPDGLALEDLDLAIYISESDLYTWDNGTTFSLQLPLLPYDQWRATHFNESQQADPLTSGPEASPNGDGVNNILKYLTGLSPWDDFTGLVMRTDASASELRISLNRADEAVDLAVAPLHSESLASWSETPEGQYTLQMDGFDSGTGTYYIELRLPIGNGTGKDFYRLAISHSLL